MKKLYISIISAFILFMPALAACPLGGACAPTTPLANPTLQDKYIPNNLQDMQQPNAFTMKGIRTFDNTRMNSGQNAPEYSPENLRPEPIYDNCQFGMCLP